MRIIIFEGLYLGPPNQSQKLPEKCIKCNPFTYEMGKWASRVSGIRRLAPRVQIPKFESFGHQKPFSLWHLGPTAPFSGGTSR